MKHFVRKLPDPLIPDAQYMAFVLANRLKDPAERMMGLRGQIHNMPICHYETFKFLATHLHKVASYSEVSIQEAWFLLKP